MGACIKFILSSGDADAFSVDEAENLLRLVHQECKFTYTIKGVSTSYINGKPVKVISGRVGSAIVANRGYTWSTHSALFTIVNKEEAAWFASESGFFNPIEETKLFAIFNINIKNIAAEIKKRCS